MQRANGAGPCAQRFGKRTGSSWSAHGIERRVVIGERRRDDEAARADNGKQGLRDHVGAAGDLADGAQRGVHEDTVAARKPESLQLVEEAAGRKDCAHSPSNRPSVPPRTAARVCSPNGASTTRANSIA